MTVASPLLNPLEPSVFYDSINLNQESLEGLLERHAIPVFICCRILKKDKVEEKTAHLVSRRLLQVVGVIGGFAGRFPFVQMNLDFAGENKVYGVALAAGSSISFGYLVSYAFLEIIQDQMGPLSPEERVLMESRLSPTLKKRCFL